MILDLDRDKEVASIADRLRATIVEFHRRGAVIGLSGGVDSSVCAALAVKALGPSKVLGLLMPERESSGASERLAMMVVNKFGIPFVRQDITGAIEAIGCYRERDEAIAHVIPEYGAGWKNKIVIAGGLRGQFNHFELVVQSPTGEVRRERLGHREYLQIVAATSYKQRTRKMVEYYHADRLNYVVIGTPNRLEYDQGFFVKNGDGSADIKPIAHLYKSQVYALAQHLQLPDEICTAAPTTDTYSMEQGQDNFYFALPYRQMDLALWAFNHDVPEEELAEMLRIPPERARFIYGDIAGKRRTTRYLHRKPVLVAPVDGIES